MHTLLIVHNLIYNRVIGQGHLPHRTNFFRLEVAIKAYDVIIVLKL